MKAIVILVDGPSDMNTCKVRGLHAVRVSMRICAVAPLPAGPCQRLPAWLAMCQGRQQEEKTEPFLQGAEIALGKDHDEVTLFSCRKKK